MFDLPLVEKHSGDATKRSGRSDTSPDEILSSATPCVASRGLQLEICAAEMLQERPKGSPRQSRDLRPARSPPAAAW